MIHKVPDFESMLASSKCQFGQKVQLAPNGSSNEAVVNSLFGPGCNFDYSPGFGVKPFNLMRAYLMQTLENQSECQRQAVATKIAEVVTEDIETNVKDKGNGSSTEEKV